MSFRNYHTCAECGAPVLVSYSRYCARHMLNQIRYGSPGARRLRASELQPFREIIGRALAARINTKPVQAALEVSHDLLHYQPTHGRRYQLDIQKNMRRLAEGGTTPYELLHCVCSVFAIEVFEERRFSSAREVDYAVAREVLKLRSMHAWRPNATILGKLGYLLREELGLFAYALTREALKHDTVREQRKADMASGWE